MGFLSDPWADRIALNPRTKVISAGDDFGALPRSGGTLDASGEKWGLEGDSGLTAKGVNVDALDKFGASVKEFPSVSAGAGTNDD